MTDRDGRKAILLTRCRVDGPAFLIETVRRLRSLCGPGPLIGIEMIGNDLTFRNSVVAPTIKIRRMTVAGH